MADRREAVNPNRTRFFRPGGAQSAGAEPSHRSARQRLGEQHGEVLKAVVNELTVAGGQWLSCLGEPGAIVAGKSERAQQAGDKRFADAAASHRLRQPGSLSTVRVAQDKG
jgi:hypothetical protein